MIHETVEFDSFGEYLKYHRSKAKISRRVLADYVGVSESLLVDVERGKSVLPKAQMLKQIQSVLPDVCEYNLEKLYLCDLVDRLSERYGLHACLHSIEVE